MLDICLWGVTCIRLVNPCLSRLERAAVVRRGEGLLGWASNSCMRMVEGWPSMHIQCQYEQRCRCLLFDSKLSCQVWPRALREGHLKVRAPPHRSRGSGGTEVYISKFASTMGPTIRLSGRPCPASSIPTPKPYSKLFNISVWAPLLHRGQPWRWEVCTQLCRPKLRHSTSRDLHRADL
eukprot:1160504-Pelagomonas_calceolata.AAC.2